MSVREVTPGVASPRPPKGPPRPDQSQRHRSTLTRGGSGAGRWSRAVTAVGLAEGEGTWGVPDGYGRLGTGREAR